MRFPLRLLTSPGATAAPPEQRFAPDAARPGLVRFACEAGAEGNGLSAQSLRSATAAAIVLDGPASDEELPESLRGKGLVRGKPVPIWPVGRSEARDGRVFLVDDEAIESLLADGNAQIVPFTYGHEEDPIHGANASGYMLHFVADASFVYADRVYWTSTAAAMLATGERGFVSPDAYCQPLHPSTLMPLPPGSGLETNTFRPKLWRAASLVGVPALKNLPPASLTAASANTRKELNMDPRLMKLLGLAADATEAQKAEALDAFRAKHRTIAGTRQALAAAGEFSREGILAVIRAAWKFPDPTVLSDEQLWQIVDATGDKSGAGTDTDDEAAAAPPDPKGQCADPPPLAAGSPPPAADPTMQAAAAVRAAMPGIVKDASAQVRQELAAKAKADAIDAELLTAEREGRIVAADREYWREQLSGKHADKARQELAAKPRGTTVPRGEIVGGTLDPSISVDSLPMEEANEILSRAAGYSMQTGCEFPIALAAVRGGDPAERSFHAQVLAANPDWGKSKKAGARGTRWPVGIRRGLSSVELDPDLLRHIGKQMKAGAIPTNLVPAKLQEAALERLQLAGEVSSFQPPTRFQVPGFAFGYFQGEFGGSEIAPEITGGANEEASYPIYGTEKLSVHVNAAGLPEPVGRNAQDKERSFWGADFKKVTLKGYGNEVWADRRDQAAGDSVLPQGVMATVTEQALTIEKNKKELAQAANLRLAANYDASNQKPLTGGRQWNDPSSTPIQDWQGGRVTLWRAVGVFPDISLIPPDVIETLKFHKDFLVAAQYAGMGDAARPNAMVPIEMLVSILGPIVVPTCRISVQPGGANADSPWGQDVIMAVTNRGKVVAPRAFATVVSAGYPIVRGMVDEKMGLNGSDGVSVSDMYAIEVVTATGLATKAAYLFQTATKQLTVA